jgi:peptidoglycan/LPS O-acetylase OafA/YrhL
MDESAIYLLLFLLCEFLVGAIVGASLGKNRPSGVHGLVISTALGLVVVVYVIIVDTVARSPFSNNSRSTARAARSIRDAVLSTMTATPA